MTELFTLTRSEMAQLLLSIEGHHKITPLELLQKTWNEHHQSDVVQGTTYAAFLSTSLPPILEKLIKGNRTAGFSLQEIASLAQMIEYSNASITSMQNWVKRDFKEYFSSPKIGKKYSIHQAALLFMIDDLKAVLDFESIRNLFKGIFVDPDRDDDDLLNPLLLYNTYADLFEHLDCEHERFIHTDTLTEAEIRLAADEIVDSFVHLTKRQHQIVRNTIFIATLSIQTTYLHSLSKRYLNATLFL
ncbi:DUF1836 domain-containing protein [Paenibacillus sp. Marseille-Q4541]|uniref:DUF1836 domain-containing protein n=1 Tax=Paenibacillus sp. Marseille-Q4541 TaxID=2831522 RepID=UPI001BAA3C64|nr:DUF1836 domain-containing protein [Paenibacillus sp. Marseille-Q4541]